MDQRTKYLNRMAILNRQPTLWRHGMPVVDVLPCDENVIKISPLTLEPMNADYDGDELNVYMPHDRSVHLELEEKAHLKNTFKCDADNTMLAGPRHESLQSCFALTENINPNFDKQPIIISKLSELPENFNYWNNELDKPVCFNNVNYTYGICLLNKWMHVKDIKINHTITKNEDNDISEAMYNDSKKLFNFHLNELNKRLLFFISSTDHCPTINVEEMINVVDNKSEFLFNKLPKTNPCIGYHINEGLVDKCIENLNPKYDLYKLYKAGSRLNKQQLSRTCINIGYVADANNIVTPTPVCSNLMKGLDSETYFLTAPGSRKGMSTMLL